LQVQFKQVSHRSSVDLLRTDNHMWRRENFTGVVISSFSI